MPTPAELASALKDRTVVVATSGGVVVSIGRVKVVSIDEGSTSSPLSIVFETETMRCELGVPVEKFGALKASDNGEHLRYTLPAGDSVWLPPPTPVQTEGEPVIETFPIPPSVAAKPAILQPADSPNPRPGSPKPTVQGTRAALDRLLRNINSRLGE